MIVGRGVGQRLHEPIWRDMQARVVPLDSAHHFERQSLVGIVACEPRNHFKMVVRLAQAVGWLICEKPMGASKSEAVKILDHVKERKIPLIVNYQLRFSESVMNRVWAALECSGPLDIIYSSPAYLMGFKRPWYKEFTQGGSAIFAVGSHLIDLIQHSCGPLSIAYVDYLSPFKFRLGTKSNLGRLINFYVDLAATTTEFYLSTESSASSLIDGEDTLSTAMSGIWRDSYRAFVSAFLNDPETTLLASASGNSAIKVHEVISQAHQLALSHFRSHV